MKWRNYLMNILVAFLIAFVVSFAYFFYISIQGTLLLPVRPDPLAHIAVAPPPPGSDKPLFVRYVSWMRGNYEEARNEFLDLKGQYDNGTLFSGSIEKPTPTPTPKTI